MIDREHAPGDGSPSDTPPRPTDASRASYRVRWSPGDGEYVATCDEYPSLSVLEGTPVRALGGIIELVADVLADERRATAADAGATYSEAELEVRRAVVTALVDYDVRVAEAYDALSPPIRAEIVDRIITAVPAHAHRAELEAERDYLRAALDATRAAVPASGLQAALDAARARVLELLNERDELRASLLAARAEEHCGVFARTAAEKCFQPGAWADTGIRGRDRGAAREKWLALSPAQRSWSEVDYRWVEK